MYSLLPRLRRVLTTREWVDWFAGEVALQLNVLDGGLRVADDGTCPGQDGRFLRSGWCASQITSALADRTHSKSLLFAGTR